MQLACPKCKQVLKLGAVNAETVAITCPKCGHAFQARVPLGQPAAPAAPPANPFDSLPPATANPASTFRQPSPAARPAASTRPSRSSRKSSSAAKSPVVPMVVGALALVLVGGLGFVGWSQRDLIFGARDSDVGSSSTDLGQPSASLLDSIASSVFGSDTPETITDDFFAIQEQATEYQVSFKSYDESELEDLLDVYLESSQESRELLQRGLGTEPRTMEQQEAFKDRYKALVEKSSKRAKQHYESLGDDAKERMRGRLLDREVVEAHPYSLMLIRFMQSGFCEIEPPEGEQSKIYVREVDLLRRLNRFLADVDDDGESRGDPAELEGFGDELAVLAAERSSAEGGGMFVERGLGDAGDVHRSLTRLYFRQIEQLHEPSKAFEDAKAIYGEAQDLFDSAKGYTAEKLRSQYAESKRAIKEPVKVAAKPPAVVKPQVKPAVKESKPDKPVPVKMAEASQGSAPPGQPDSSAVASSGGGAAKGGGKSGSQPSASQSSEGSRRPGFGGMSRGPSGVGPGGFGPRGFRSPGGRPMESSERGRFGGPGGFPGQSGFAGRNGPSERGGGSDGGRGGPASAAPIERFKGPDGATLLFKKTDDLAGTAKKWAAALGVKEYLVRSSFDQGELMIRWSGSMEELGKKIQFATVETVDESKRQIRIKVE